MLGKFDSFPKNVHQVAIFNCENSKNKVQQTILQTFQALNNKEVSINSIMPFINQDYQVSFEFGIADGASFTFLDDKELEKTIKTVNEKDVEILDFFVVVRYHKKDNKGKQIPLRFDYNVLRFAFHEKILEFLIRHERGTQRVSTEDLIEFLTKQLNAQLKKSQLSLLSSD